MAREKKSTNSRRDAAMAEKRRPLKKRSSPISLEKLDWIDYKDVNLLRRFMSERAKIRARRVSGNTAQQQREVARAIRVAREMALLPYSVRQVTQRSKGGGKRDRYEGREERSDENTTLGADAVEAIGAEVEATEAVIADVAIADDVVTPDVSVDAVVEAPSEEAGK